jgi:hypothetical protein
MSEGGMGMLCIILRHCSFVLQETEASVGLTEHREQSFEFGVDSFAV